MSPANIARLIALGAIWGSSFMLMRIAVPDLGPLPTAFGRIVLGGVALGLFARWRGIEFAWRRNARVYLVIGVTNTAVPFALFAWAALHIPSAYMATMNALAPVFTAMFGFLLMAERLSPMRIASFVLGFGGVAVLVNIGPTAVDAHVIGGILAGIGAAVCYGFAAIYTRMNASRIAPLAAASGSQIMASLALLPFTLPALPSALAHAQPASAAAVIILGLLCTGFAYALFFHLIAAEGPGKAVMVTFLVPAAAALWAWAILHEPVTAGTVIGLAIVLCATALALGIVGQVRTLFGAAPAKP
jgi:drug/metabolite transporter (DMT)-like permease